MSLHGKVAASIVSQQFSKPFFMLLRRLHGRLRTEVPCGGYCFSLAMEGVFQSTQTDTHTDARGGCSWRCFDGKVLLDQSCSQGPFAQGILAPCSSQEHVIFDQTKWPAGR